MPGRDAASVGPAGGPPLWNLLEAAQHLGAGAVHKLAVERVQPQLTPRTLPGAGLPEVLGAAGHGALQAVGNIDGRAVAIQLREGAA